MLSLKPSPSRIALVKNVKMWGFEAFLTYFSWKSTDFGDFVRAVASGMDFLKLCFAGSPCQEIISADHGHSKCCWDAHCCLWIRKFMMRSLSSVQLPPQNLKTLPKRSSKWRLFLERAHPDFTIFNYFRVKTLYLHC